MIPGTHPLSRCKKSKTSRTGSSKRETGEALRNLMETKFDLQITRAFLMKIIQMRGIGDLCTGEKPYLWTKVVFVFVFFLCIVYM